MVELHGLLSVQTKKSVLGADQFDVKQFPVDYAYTIDGESLGQLKYETFNAAGGTVILKGVSVHRHSQGHYDQLC